MLSTMTWDYETVLNDFNTVTRLAGVELPEGAIIVETLSAPHVPPATLPVGKMAVYVFSKGPDVLKVGKVGRKSRARYTSQHYNPISAMSTLAASVLGDREQLGCEDVDAGDVGSWIRGNIDRVNLLMDEHVGVRVLTLLEAFLQCRLRPRYEGFKSQA